MVERVLTIIDHEHGVDDPFFLDEAGVDGGQTGQALETDESSGGQLPGIVAIVEPCGRRVDVPWWSGHGEDVQAKTVTWKWR